MHLCTYEALRHVIETQQQGTRSVVSGAIDRNANENGGARTLLKRGWELKLMATGWKAPMADAEGNGKSEQLPRL